MLYSALTAGGIFTPSTMPSHLLKLSSKKISLIMTLCSETRHRVLTAGDFYYLIGKFFVIKIIAPAKKGYI